ncbi:hypothetical protein GCM10023311_21310 [Flaviramulus aquimarinus]|uniref:Uncharacterized protein n=1 Tax=Flaviramulus aquimarinus TaxID=1170456 RepID=A0ABP9FAC9_9FLAO
MRKLVLILFSILALSSYCQDKNCSEFKTGEFEYSNSNYSEWKINRTDSIQIEISTKNQIEIQSSIEWKSDCEFILTCRKVSNPNFEHLIGKIFKYKIIKTFDDRYICISKGNDIQPKHLELEMIKMN